MNIRDETERKVLFNARDELGGKIDKLTAMMGRLAVKDSNDKRPFKPQIYKREVLTLNIKTEYTIREIIKIEVDQAADQTVETEDSMEIIEQDCSKTTEGTISKKTLGDMEDKTVEENTETIGVMVTTIEVGIGQEKGHSQEIMAVIGIEVQVIVDQDQDLELILIQTE